MILDFFLALATGFLGIITGFLPTWEALPSGVQDTLNTMVGWAVSLNWIIPITDAALVFSVVVFVEIGLFVTRGILYFVNWLRGT